MFTELYFGTPGARITILRGTGDAIVKNVVLQIIYR